MPTQEPGKTAAWTKFLAAFILLVLMPLVIWFMVSFQESGAIPW